MLMTTIDASVASFFLPNVTSLLIMNSGFWGQCYAPILYFLLGMWHNPSVLSLPLLHFHQPVSVSFAGSNFHCYSISSAFMTRSASAVSFTMANDRQGTSSYQFMVVKLLLLTR